MQRLLRVPDMMAGNNPLAFSEAILREDSLLVPLTQTHHLHSAEILPSVRLGMEWASYLVRVTIFRSARLATLVPLCPEASRVHFEVYLQIRWRWWSARVSGVQRRQDTEPSQ